MLVEGNLTALDLKIFDPLGSQPANAGERGGFVAFGNTAEAANACVLGRSERGAAGDGRYNRRTGEGHVAAVTGDYERALQSGVRCVPMLLETFGGFGLGLMGVLRQADEWRQGRLVSSEYDDRVRRDGMGGAQLHVLRGAAHLGRCADLLRAGDRRGPRALGRGGPAGVSGLGPLGGGG